MKLRLALLLGVFLMLADCARAQELIVNGGFENTGGTFAPDVNNIMSLPANSTAIPGWTVVNAEIIWGGNNNPFGPATPYGTLFLDLTGYHDFPPYAGVRQTIVTTNEDHYRLSFSLGTYQSTPVYAGPVAVVASAAGVSNVFNFNPGGSSNQWATFGMDFTATGAVTTVTITGTQAFGGAYLGLDNVSVMPLGPQLQIVPASPSQVAISWTPALTGYVLQERASLSSGIWSNSVSGSTNPVVVPASMPTKFYRLFKP